jgi:hypothetical protein
MRSACDNDAACDGLTHDVGGVWRAFAGTLKGDTVRKVPVVGTAINSWVAEPTGKEENKGWPSVALVCGVPGRPGGGAVALASCLLRFQSL